jgi:hypothetical protein
MPKHVGAAIYNKLNKQLLHLLAFYAYINEMHGSRSKSPAKNLVRHRCMEGFNSGIKGLNNGIDWNVGFMQVLISRCSFKASLTI